MRSNLIGRDEKGVAKGQATGTSRDLFHFVIFVTIELMSQNSSSRRPLPYDRQYGSSRVTGSNSTTYALLTVSYQSKTPAPTVTVGPFPGRSRTGLRPTVVPLVSDRQVDGTPAHDVDHAITALGEASDLRLSAYNKFEIIVGINRRTSQGHWDLNPAPSDQVRVPTDVQTLAEHAIYTAVEAGAFGLTVAHAHVQRDAAVHDTVSNDLGIGHELGRNS